jgi:hypothetical protein
MTENKWKDYSFDELANEAHVGLRGQGAAVEAMRRLIMTMQASGDCTATQNAHLITLTRAIRTLTVALFAVGVIQVLLMWWLKGGV